MIVPNSTHTAHPRFLPYVQPSPNSVSAYADHVAAVLNQNCNLWHLSPAANAVEQTVLCWFADLFGFPASAGGIITSGGSIANLVALTAARDHALGDAARSRGCRAATLRSSSTPRRRRIPASRRPFPSWVSAPGGSAGSALTSSSAFASINWGRRSPPIARPVSARSA